MARHATANRLAFLVDGADYYAALRDALGELLADLFELELDKMKNQYETVQREAEQQLQQEVDEELDKLKELARRQEQEAERQRRRAAAGQSSSGGSQAELPTGGCTMPSPPCAAASPA